MRTVAVVLAHNEETHLPHTLRILNKRKKQGLLDHIIVIDDGSENKNKTQEIAQQAGAELKRLDTNIGRRLGFIEATKAAHKAGAQAMLILDADILYFPANTLKQMKTQIETGKYLMAMPLTYERRDNLPKEQELQRPKRINLSPRERLTGLQWWQYNTPIQIEDFIGQRLISMKALTPLINGNKKWIEYLTPPTNANYTGRWGFETALKKLIPLTRITKVPGPIFNREIGGNESRKKTSSYSGQAVATNQIDRIFYNRLCKAIDHKIARKQRNLIKRR